MEELFFSIEGLDPNQAQQEARALKNWLEQDDDLDYDSIKTQRKELAPDEAGGALEATLAVVLSAPAIVQLAKALQVWLRERTKTENGQKIEVEVTTKKGKKIKVKAQQINQNTLDLVKELKTLLDD
jgi:hypothetical protein